MVTRTDQIRIDRLLLQREEQLARIASIERRIEALLGEPYPLPPPPDLPSLRRRSKKSIRKPAKKGRRAAQPSFRLRPLEETESGYRIEYLDAEGEPCTEKHFDTRLLNVLLNNPTEGMQVRKIETLDEEGNPCELLFENTLERHKIDGGESPSSQGTDLKNEV